jgi:hypothetical protein
MKHKIWSSLVAGFIVTCFLSGFIDNSYRSFGYRACEKLKQYSEGRERCEQAVKEEVSDRSTPLALGIWLISALLLRYTTFKDES